MIDQTIAFTLDTLRLDAATRARIEPILDELQRQITAALATSDLASKRRVEALIKRANELIESAYAEARVQLSATTEGLAPIAAVAAGQTLAAGLPPSITVAKPAASALANDPIIMGATQRDWWRRQAADTAWRFAAAVRQGWIAGETNGQIIARIVGRAGFPGVMEVSRKNAAALVQTSVATVANEARMATFRANEDLIARYRWITALDGHVCIQCAGLADKTWRPDEKMPVPPIHFNDRCVLVPETKTWAELGIELPEFPSGMRGSRDGPVPAATTFADYLKRQSAEMQNDVLGEGRADLWRAGKITLADLINGRNNPLSLAQLRARYANS